MADNINVTPGTGASIAADDIGGNLHQRVKLSVGADGSATDVREAADGLTVGVVPAGGLMWDATSSTWQRLRSARSEGDGAGGGVTLGVAPYTYNGATYDRQRGNTEGVLLASAARTTTATSATMTNHNARGVLVVITITVASGTGGLGVRIIGSTNGNTYFLNAVPTAITATGTYAYEVCPGASSAGVASSGSVNQRTAAALPRTWQGHVTVGDASSYTYQLDYSLIL